MLCNYYCASSGTVTWYDVFAHPEILLSLHKHLSYSKFSKFDLVRMQLAKQSNCFQCLAVQ